MITFSKRLIKNAVTRIRQDIVRIYQQKVKKISKDPNDFKQRFHDILRDPNNEYIPRVPKAGQIIKGCQIMHNGLKVSAGRDSYYGKFSDILKINKGVHEPQEERVFMEVLKTMPENSTIIELGAYWSFYSMWFSKEVKNAKCYIIEPDPRSLKVGKKNFKLNNMKGDFTRGKIGRNGIKIDDFIKEKNIRLVNIIHSDIQGKELQMLKGAKKSISQNKIHYFFISTHSQRLHYKCLSFLKKYGYTIIASADYDNETFCFDGVLVARLTKIKGIRPLNIAVKKQEQLQQPPIPQIKQLIKNLARREHLWKQKRDHSGKRRK